LTYPACGPRLDRHRFCRHQSPLRLRRRRRYHLRRRRARGCPLRRHCVSAAGRHLGGASVSATDCRRSSLRRSLCRCPWREASVPSTPTRSRPARLGCCPGAGCGFGSDSACGFGSGRRRRRCRPPRRLGRHHHRRRPSLRRAATRCQGCPAGRPWGSQPTGPHRPRNGCSLPCCLGRGSHPCPVPMESARSQTGLGSRADWSSDRYEADAMARWPITVQT
jgi:hypothetical protein